MREETRRELVKFFYKLGIGNCNSADYLADQIEALFEHSNEQERQALKGGCECPSPYFGTQPVGRWPMCERCGRNVRPLLSGDRRKGERRVKQVIMIPGHTTIRKQDRRQDLGWHLVAKELQVALEDLYSKFQDPGVCGGLDAKTECGHSMCREKREAVSNAVTILAKFAALEKTDPGPNLVA